MKTQYEPHVNDQVIETYTGVDEDYEESSAQNLDHGSRIGQKKRPIEKQNIRKEPRNHLTKTQLLCGKILNHKDTKSTKETQ